MQWTTTEKNLIGVVVWRQIPLIAINVSDSFLIWKKFAFYLENTRALLAFIVLEQPTFFYGGIDLVRTQPGGGQHAYTVQKLM